MAKVKEELWKILQDLKEEEFQTFKWFLKLDDNVEGFSGIPVAQLEKAERQHAVDLLVQKYQGAGAVRVTMEVLEKISRNDLVQRLKNCSREKKDPNHRHSDALKGDFEKRKAELGARLQLLIQERQMKIRELKCSAELSGKSADRHIADSERAFSVLLQTLKESLENLNKSINDKRRTVQTQTDQFIRELEQEISELTKKSSEVQQLSHTEDQLNLIQNLTVPPTKTWTEVHISPPSYGGSLGTAIAGLEEKLREHKERFIAQGKLNRVQQFVKDVTLDPDTAHPSLVLSQDGKQVHCGAVKRNLADNSKRFLSASNVLGKQGFSSGRFYFQVQVKGKTSWDLGVVKESIDRKGPITASPENGYWTICLRNGLNYQASGVSARLSVKSNPQTVGVFVDYGKCSVSFFDVDSADILHSFTQCSFTEELYPFFSPGPYRSGTNSIPLLICPVLYTHSCSITLTRASIRTSQEAGCFRNPPQLIMAGLKKELWRTLHDLTETEFDQFKWFLKEDNSVEGFSGIRVAQLEKATRQNTVDLMVQKYPGPGALKVTSEILKDISRNDLVQRLQNFSLEQRELKTKTQRSEQQNPKRTKSLTWVQRFAVEVTFDPDTAQPSLILSRDGKQVHHGDVRKKLPDNPERFDRCVNVLGKQSFSSGRSYFEVQVEGKTAWTVGVSKESIKRKGSITLGPGDGFWTFGLRNETEYLAHESHVENLPLKSHPKKVGVFLDYEEGLVSFYDVDSADHLYSFTGCSFTERLYPFFSPCTNEGGVNSAPLIITPLNHSLKKVCADDEDRDHKKKAELKSVQQFAVEVTFDPDTAHPALTLSDDKKQAYCGKVCWNLPDNPERFRIYVNVLGKQSFSSGRSYFEVQVKGKTAWAVGVAKESIDRKGDIIAKPKYGYWTIMLTNGDEYEVNDDDPVSLSVSHRPQKVGVFVDYEEGLVSFYDVDVSVHLCSFTDCSFTERLYPFFTPFMNQNGLNAAPLIICQMNHPSNPAAPVYPDQKMEQDKKKAELKSVQRFAVEVTFDPDTAHPALTLSDDKKQAYCGEVCRNLPDNPERFRIYVNVLGKQSFSSGRSYFEVQVKGKTAWAVGVAKESIDRKGKTKLGPGYGYWTIWLRNGDEYTANDVPSAHLALKSHPQKVGVFVNYEEGLVCFYDVDTADLLYIFTDCSFTERLYPFFTPFMNQNGLNAAPLIICQMNHPSNPAAPVYPDQKMEQDKKKAELKSVQRFAVEMTFDPDTAHPALTLSDDCKQVHHGDEWKKLPDNPERFRRCGNVLGKQSFSSGRSYFEVQVKGKTAWTVGVAKESIDRKGKTKLGPGYGYWTIWLRNGDEYTAIDVPSARLALKSHPQKVGVFVNYEEGLVCFYDVDTADLLYIFTDCSFTERLYPFFSPSCHDNGINSAPLIICPVDKD
ncbi:uncharacterized protein LOC117809940 [Notolabrus celidotus]|uniref:uncharacterized protein LOC117809940 n=1 Tax=Notolabrus celidotus TaxID=1203425 RepID=UPI00148FF7A3|nr:uncharacterized protein LOC117809940 [Notolabrus celidotus]